jgi:hypothetical protein
MSRVRAQRRRSGGAHVVLALAAALGAALPAQPALAQPRQIDLTVDRLVQLTMDNSYQIQLLRMGVEQTRLRLRAERAGLKSRVRLDMTVPTFESVSETQYNSALGRNEIVRENSRRWEGQFSIQQPVILLGYPTNGYLSLNNRVYRYSQIDPDGDRDLTWYNRYFVQYTQPLFQANELKNEIESAELDLEDSEIEFEGDMMEIVGDAYETHRDLFENVYGQKITSDYVANLQLALQAAQAAVAANPARSIDLDQVRVELTNAEQRLASSQNSFRRDVARLKSELNLPEDAEITIQPVIEVKPVQVDVETG